MATKTVPNSVFIGNEGAYLVPELVNETRFLLTPSGQFELGINGTIKVGDPTTSKGTGNIIKVQIKTTSQPLAWKANHKSLLTMLATSNLPKHTMTHDDIASMWLDTRQPTSRPANPLQALGLQSRVYPNHQPNAGIHSAQ